MKFFVQTIIIAALCVAMQIFLPWWTAALAGVMGGLMFYNKSVISFAEGFIAVFVVWLCYAFWLDAQNVSVLSSKIAVLFSVQKPYILMLVSSLIGGITGGLGSWAGSEGRKLMS